MSTAAVVLAAGLGTRFRSDRAKVLHHVGGRTLLRWVLEALRPLELDRVVVVIGHQREAVVAEAEAAALPGLVSVVQEPQRGTGHAVRVAFEAGALEDTDTVLVVPGDAPMLQPGPLRELLLIHGANAATLLTTRLGDPTGYGRVVRDVAGNVTRIVEHRDADDVEREIDEVATSIYAFDAEQLRGELRRLRTSNVQGEEYLTDVIEGLGSAPKASLLAPSEIVAGVNDRAELAAAGKVLRQRILTAHMRAGVTVVDPEATYVEADVEIGADSLLMPGTHLEGRCRLGVGVVVGPDTRLRDTVVEDGSTVQYSVTDGASIGPDVSVGPFSYLRPGTRLERGAKAGTFVEMKNSTVGEGSKVPHLSYMGDATIGRGVNIGAGTITCNYDGVAKHPTIIEDDAFIGSDTMLIAPVRVGAGAYTGAGSAIAKDVPPGALAVERTEQRHVDDFGARRAKSTDAG